MDVTSYEYRISQVKNRHDLDIQIIKARILARSLTDQAFWPSSSDKTLLIESAMEAQGVEWQLAMNYFEILEACKGEKEKPEMEMEGKGCLMATGLPEKGDRRNI